MSASTQEMSAQVQQVVIEAQSLLKMAGDLKEAINLFEIREKETVSTTKEATVSGNGDGDGKKAKSNIKHTIKIQN
jgi:hypothetical protein